MWDTEFITQTLKSIIRTLQIVNKALGERLRDLLTLSKITRARNKEKNLVTFKQTNILPVSILKILIIGLEKPWVNYFKKDYKVFMRIWFAVTFLIL